MLVKYNLVQKQNEKNERLAFAANTGAHLPRYDNFLDDEGTFSGKKKKPHNELDGLSPDGDTLNKRNRQSLRDF